VVSVILPVRNRAAVVERAVRSVWTQTWQDWELVAVDDGSDDATRAVLEDLAAQESRMRVLATPPRGVSHARNRGVEASAGAWIALLDSDDLWLPRKLEAQMRFVADSGFSACQTEEIWIRHGRRVNPCRKHVKPAGWFLERAVALCLISPSCVLFSRALWEQVGPFDEDLPACEDYALWLRLLLVAPVGLVPQALVVKTGGHEDQLSRLFVGQDRFRLEGLRRALARAQRAEDRRVLAAEMVRRGRIYQAGCLKHGLVDEAVLVGQWMRQARALVEP
jgi:glycosyltransferase involved in cell wall biosynthesis